MEKKSFAKNAFACILASIIIGASFARTTKQFFSDFIPLIVAVGLAALLVVTSIIFSIAWYRKEKTGKFDSSRRLALFQGLLRYGIAFELCMIGWQKIFHHQFITPIGKLDNPFSSFSLGDLMWAFFGQSYPFIVVIGLTQIIGSVLLLFSRTRLLAVFILIPVLLNIILIDIFYEIGGVLGQAIILFVGVLYFLLIEYDRLKVFFFLSKNDDPSVKVNGNLIRNALRFSVVIIPLLIIFTNKELMPYTLQRTQLPEGRYEVRQLSINQKDIKMDDCRDSVLTMVYLQHDVVFQSGSVQKRLFGKYSYDNNTRQMKAIWHYPRDRKDTLVALVTRMENKLIIDGKMGINAVRMELVKTDPPKYP